MMGVFRNLTIFKSIIGGKTLLIKPEGSVRAFLLKAKEMHLPCKSILGGQYEH